MTELENMGFARLTMDEICTTDRSREIFLAGLMVARELATGDLDGDGVRYLINRAISECEERMKMLIVEGGHNG